MCVCVAIEVEIELCGLLLQGDGMTGNGQCGFKVLGLRLVESTQVFGRERHVYLLACQAGKRQEGHLGLQTILQNPATVAVPSVYRQSIFQRGAKKGLLWPNVNGQQESRVKSQ